MSQRQPARPDDSFRLRERQWGCGSGLIAILCAMVILPVSCFFCSPPSGPEKPAMRALPPSYNYKK